MTLGTKKLDDVVLIAHPDFASAGAKVSSFFLGEFFKTITGERTSPQMSGAGSIGLVPWISWARDGFNQMTSGIFIP